MSSTRVFQSVGSVRPGRSVFDLSYEKKFTCDMGQLIPVMVDEVVPGDVFKISNEIVLRFQPLVAPIMHEVNVFMHYFFVPYRILWDDWEDFITGGVDGQDASVLPREAYISSTQVEVGSLWDYLGFPPDLELEGLSAPMSFPRWAYNKIYNDFYRDQQLVAELDITVADTVQLRAWEKDYFTSALPWQQRGTAPALPISGIVNAVGSINYPAFSTANSQAMYADSVNPGPYDAVTEAALESGVVNVPVNLSTASTFNVSDIRLAFQIQKWLERNARAGARYTEFLRAHYGVSPRDERLQRPEYIGGTRSPVIVSEVLQTSQTTEDASPQNGSPQGNMAGHGITVDSQFAAKYHAEEFGLIMGIMSVMPRSSYSQGVNRQWLRRTKYDFYAPEFANLSEQAVELEEVYAQSGDPNTNGVIFGYQGRYNEMRYKPNMVVGEMRELLDYWHLSRWFTGVPTLNQSFIECAPDKRIFAVQTVPSMIVNVANKIVAIRPMPMSAEPGLIDHG